jgi:hypothetical protein
VLGDLARVVLSQGQTACASGSADL